MDYGSVTYEGVSYRLQEQAEQTCRVFPGWWGDAKAGERYLSEWFAPALSPDGEKVTVYWQFEQIRGNEQEPDSLDWERGVFRVWSY